MILFNLNTQTSSGDGCDKIKEVVWRGNKCVVNQKAEAEVNTQVISAGSAKEVAARIENIISSSKADLFAILRQTMPYKIGNRVQATFVYSEVNL